MQPSTPEVAGTRLSPRWVLAGLAAVVAACVLSLCVGAASIAPLDALAEVVDHVPFVSIDSGLSPSRAAIVWEVRFPRIVLGLMVGGMLALSGASYQGVFRNPLADPYLLGVGAGAGLGATVAIVAGVGDGAGMLDPLPLAAFAGAIGAVALTYALGAASGRLRSPATLVLAGVAVANFFTALQTYLQQRESETFRQVYQWLLGRLFVQGWDEVAVLVPYFVVTTVVLLASRRLLDVLSVGDDEARTLGVDPARIRIVVVVAASLAAAAAVAVSGLIGFVGIIVPHTIRQLTGPANRVVLPLSLLGGAAFLVLSDLVARSIVSPAELPIGVITAFFGAPFFLLVLRTTTRDGAS